MLHRQLQATAVAAVNHAASAALEGSAVGSAAAASAPEGADTRTPHFAFFGDASTLHSFAAKGMRVMVLPAESVPPAEVVKVNVAETGYAFPYGRSDVGTTNATPVT